MKRESKSIPLLALGLILMMALAFAIVYVPTLIAKASAPSGLAATVATSTTFAIAAATATTITATTTNCASRNISTGATGALLTFDDRYTPTGVFGIWQAASTTKEYDGGLYGCGAIKMYSLGAQTLNIIVTQ